MCFMSRDDDAPGDIFRVPDKTSLNRLLAVNAINPEMESNLDPHLTSPLFFEPKDAINAVRDIENHNPTLIFAQLDQELLKIMKYNLSAENRYYKAFSEHMHEVQSSYPEQLTKRTAELAEMEQTILNSHQIIRNFLINNWDELNDFNSQLLREVLMFDFQLWESEHLEKTAQEIEENDGNRIRHMDKLRNVPGVWMRTWDLLYALKLQEKEIILICASIEWLENQKKRFKQMYGQFVLKIYEKAWECDKTMEACNFFDIRP